MDGQLTDPDSSPELDLNLSRNLLRCLLWAGPKNPMADSALRSSADTIEQEFRQALDWEYLVVVRIVQYERPEIVVEGQYRGGNLDLEVFLIRKSDQQLVAAFPVRAMAADRVNVSYQKSDSLSERAQAFVNSSVWQEARKQVADGLQKVTGGRFTVD